MKWFVLLLVVTSCAYLDKTPAPVVQQPVIQEPTPIVEEIIEEPEPEPEPVLVWTSVTQTNEYIQINKEILQAGEVFCDLEGERIQFRLFNPSNKHWYLGNIMPLKPPPETTKARILLNEDLANGPVKYKDGVKLFGAGEFPENCENTTILSSGEHVTCTVPLQLRTAVNDKPNVIQIDLLGTDHDTILKFFC